MPTLTDLADFIADHRPHGALTADAAEPAWNGYLLTVACSCGVTFERWVTPWDAELDLLRSGGVELSPAPKPSSRLVGSLRHDHPLKPPEERVDVIRAPFSQAAIHFSGQDQPTSLGMSSVKDYVNVGVTGETLLQRCVRQRITTRNDQ